MPGAIAHERRWHVADAIEIPHIRGYLLVDVRELAGVVRGDGFAPRIDRELHHLPRRPALWRIVGRKHNGVHEDAAAACLVEDEIEIHAGPGHLTIREHDDHFPVGTLPGSFGALLSTYGDQHGVEERRAADGLHIRQRA